MPTLSAVTRPVAGCTWLVAHGAADALLQIIQTDSHGSSHTLSLASRARDDMHRYAVRARFFPTLQGRRSRTGFGELVVPLDFGFEAWRGDLYATSTL